MKVVKEGSGIHSTFREVYRQFLLELTKPTRPLLKDMTSQSLSTELEDYLSDNIELNGASL